MPARARILSGARIIASRGKGRPGGPASRVGPPARRGATGPEEYCVSTCRAGEEAGREAGRERDPADPLARVPAGATPLGGGCV